MGMTIDHFTHHFVRDEAPSVERAKALHAKLYERDDDDVWGVFPVVCGEIDWMDWPAPRMYGLDEQPQLNSTRATGFLVVYVSQERGFAVWGEEGWRELERDWRRAAERSYTDFCRLVGRLIEADEIRERHCKSP